MPTSRIKKIFRKHRSGFTLVELLIVMAIIGVLATILISSFIGVRERARDGRRKSDISQIQAALEQYRSDQGGYPPTTSTNPIAPCGGQFSNGSGSVYMQSVPCDPLGTSSSLYNSGSYYYSSDGTNYQLDTCIENSSDSDPRITSCPSTGTGGTCGTGKCYQVTNP